MIIFLLLDISDIRRHLSSPEILFFNKGCCINTSTVPKDKCEKISANYLYGPAISQSDCRKAGPYQLTYNNDVQYEKCSDKKIPSNVYRLGRYE